MGQSADSVSEDPREPVFAEPSADQHPRVMRTRFLEVVGAVFPDEKHRV